MWGVWGVWLARKAVGHRLWRDGLARMRTLHTGGCVAGGGDLRCGVCAAVGHRLRHDGLARTRTLHIGGCVPPEAVTYDVGYVQP